MIIVGQLAHLPGLLSYTYSGGEPIGNYQLFSALSTPGVFADGRIDVGDIKANDIDTVTYKGFGLENR